MAGIARVISLVPQAQAIQTGTVKGWNPNIATGWPSMLAIHVHSAGTPPKTLAAIALPGTPSGNWHMISRRSSSRRLAPM